MVTTKSWPDLENKLGEEVKKGARYASMLLSLEHQHLTPPKQGCTCFNCVMAVRLSLTCCCHSCVFKEILKDV